jgi:hypothetical protein
MTNNSTMDQDDGSLSQPIEEIQIPKNSKTSHSLCHI